MDAGTAVVQIDQIAGSNIGSIYALKSHITTAPTAPVPVGFETIQVLDVAESSKFSDSNVTFTVLVKGVGHVNNINLSVFTALPGTLASPQVLGTRNPVLAVAIPVTTLGFTLCKITCTMPSLAGGIVLGVSIAPSGASTGNTSDVGNGLILEQAMLSYAPSFFNRAYNDAGVELSACQRFYESTYEDGIAPGTITDSGQMEFYATGTNNVLSVQFKTRKRILGGTLIFSPNTGTSGKIFDITTAADKTAGASLGGYTGGFVMTTTGETSGDLCSLHWASDAEIY
jgi:hypothetical protein